MLNGVGPLASLTCYFPEDVFGTSIRWIDFEFLLEFCFGCLGIRWSGLRLRK